jgi:hypothetical protein
MDRQYRDALLRCIDRYEEIILSEDYKHNDLVALLREFRDALDVPDPVPQFCGWVWSFDETRRLRDAFEKRHGENCSTEALFSVAAEGVRIWCERGMPGLGDPLCPSKR